MIKLNNIKAEINNVLNTIPNNEIDRSHYAEKVKKYSNACGCSTGAVFLFASMGIFICWVFINTDWKDAHPMKFMWQGFLFIFLSASLGKILGIGIARLKLVILYYSLTKKHKYHVNMYEMDK